jgi:hypothetical protein
MLTNSEISTLGRHSANHRQLSEETPPMLLARADEVLE